MQTHEHLQEYQHGVRKCNKKFKLRVEKKFKNGGCLSLFLKDHMIRGRHMETETLACQSAVRSLEAQTARKSKDKNRLLCKQKFFALNQKICSSLKCWKGRKKRLPICKLAAMNFGVLLSPHSMREMKDISLELEWMQMEENQPGSATTDSGALDGDDTTLIERVEPSSFGCSG